MKSLVLKALDVFIHALCNLLCIGNGFYYGPCSKDNITGCEDAGMCRLSLLVCKQKTVLRWFETFCCVYKLRFRSLADSDECVIGMDRVELFTLSYDVSLFIDDVLLEYRSSTFMQYSKFAPSSDA